MDRVFLLISMLAAFSCSSGDFSGQSRTKKASKRVSTTSVNGGVNDSEELIFTNHPSEDSEHDGEIDFEDGSGEAVGGSGSGNGSNESGDADSESSSVDGGNSDSSADDYGDDSVDDGDSTSADDAEDQDFSEAKDFDDVIIEDYEYSCEDDDDAIEYPDETLVMTNPLVIRDFVNDRCKSSIPSTGSIHADPVTAKIICQLQGYRQGIILIQGSYSSPKNNFLAEWDEDGLEMVTSSAKGRNQKIHKLECRGKYVDRCNLERVELDCR